MDVSLIDVIHKEYNKFYEARDKLIIQTLNKKFDLNLENTTESLTPYKDRITIHKLLANEDVSYWSFDGEAFLAITEISVEDPALLHRKFNEPHEINLQFKYSEI